MAHGIGPHGVNSKFDLLPMMHRSRGAKGNSRRPKVSEEAVYSVKVLKFGVVAPTAHQSRPAELEAHEKIS